MSDDQKVDEVDKEKIKIIHNILKDFLLSNDTTKNCMTGELIISLLITIYEFLLQSGNPKESLEWFDKIHKTFRDSIKFEKKNEKNHENI